MTKPKIRTMQDLLAQLDRLGYTPAVQAQIRPEIKNCARVYGQPLDRIAADAADFEARWGRGRVGAIALGFDRQDQFVRWRKRVRQALGRIAGSPAKPGLLPEWQDLIDAVQRQAGIGRPLGPHQHLSIGVVARQASVAGIAPRDVGSAWVAEAAAPLGRAERRSFKTGVEALGRVIGRRDLCPDLDRLLPEEAPQQPPRKPALPSTFRRGGCPEAAGLWDRFDDFVRAKRGTDALDRPIPAEHSPFKPASEKVYEGAVSAALALLEQSGHLRPGDRPRLEIFTRPEVIEAVINGWKTRQIRGELSDQSATLHLLVCRLIHIAEWLGAAGADLERLHRARTLLRKSNPAHGTMSPARLAWIKDFARQPQMQRAVYSMPDTLMRESRALLSQWDRLGQKARMRALHLGIAAAQSAILLRGSPMRAANLREITFRGEGAQLHRDARGNLGVAIPAVRVKNLREIEATFDDDAMPVLDWYLAEIRLRLIGDHPYGHPRVDSDFLFPSTRDGQPMDSTTFEEHYARGCEAAGVVMTLHQARHVSAYAILLADPGAWWAAAAVLCDDISTVRKYYGWIDEARATAEGRRMLQQARTEASRHRRGSHAA